jgi:hypothetical protein
MASTINATPTSSGLISTADNSGVLALQTGGTTAVTVDGSQNVGIGVTTVGAKLDAYQEIRVSYANANQYRMRFTDTDGNGRILVDGDASALIFGTSAAGTNATATERMRIDSSGNVLVATTSLRENERLSISRNSTTTAATVINAFNTAATSTTKNTNSIVRFASGASNADVNIHLSDVTTNDYIVGGNNGGLYCMSNTQGVRLASGGTSWSSDSDERLKENLVSISNALSKVNTLRAVTGNYIDDEDKRSRAFLIAQDVQAVLPEAIDATDPERLGLQYTDVIPLLVSAIKELNAKVDAQATTIAELQARNT